jgi:hypothetical protein
MEARSMSNYIEVVAIVEGKTEQVFIEKILAPYLGHKYIGIRATQVSKPGQKGGDVHFSRVKRDLGDHLKQRSDTYVTTFIDYYGTKEWPGLDSVPPQASPEIIAKTVNDATKAQINTLFSAQQTDRRFIPFVAVHEFEALLFSDAEILAQQLGVEASAITTVISACGSPEAINNNPQTAPSKRLDAWSANNKFLKTITGISIAEKIGIEKIREQCPLFNSWLATFEEIQRATND